MEVLIPLCHLTSFATSGQLCNLFEPQFFCIWSEIILNDIPGSTGPGSWWAGKCRFPPTLVIYTPRALSRLLRSASRHLSFASSQQSPLFQSHCAHRVYLAFLNWYGSALPWELTKNGVAGDRSDSVGLAWGLGTCVFPFSLCSLRTIVPHLFISNYVLLLGSPSGVLVYTPDILETPQRHRIPLMALSIEGDKVCFSFLLKFGFR